jgi:hypothetical protein
MATHPLSVLVLDDDPTRHAAFIRNNPNCRIDSVYTCKQAFAKVMDTSYDIICFDHDLGLADGTTAQYETSLPFARAVRGLIDDKAILDDTMMVVHTANPVGAQDILSLFSRTMNPAFKVPWAWTMPNLFHTITDRQP